MQRNEEGAEQGRGKQSRGGLDEGSRSATFCITRIAGTGYGKFV